jgi:hypothetical protein
MLVKCQDIKVLKMKNIKLIVIKIMEEDKIRDKKIIQSIMMILPMIKMTKIFKTNYWKM